MRSRNHPHVRGDHAIFLHQESEGTNRIQNDVPFQFHRKEQQNMDASESDLREDLLPHIRHIPEAHHIREPLSVPPYTQTYQT